MIENGKNQIVNIMLKYLKKLFNADVTISPVVSINDEEVKTYNTVLEAIADLKTIQISQKKNWIN
ncbi:MAG: hypothetical protein IPL53_00235 [Ignavibacteria bacterium]|nr:hypothetical protein [Ignavibacteria bacterium]